MIQEDPARLATLEYAKPLQHEPELQALTELLKREGVRSYLEIGARYGGSFERIMMAIGPARGVAVDFPGGPFGDESSAPILLAALDRLKRCGSDVRAILGPSGAPEVHRRVMDLAPFDAVTIDADHAYEAVCRDFSMYAAFARIAVLHDIAAPPHIRSRDGRPVEVPRFWKQIKRSYRHEEIVMEGSEMGIGILFRDNLTWLP